MGNPTPNCGRRILEARLDPSQPWLGNAAYFVKMLGILRVCAEKARCHPMKLSVREVYGQRYVIFDAFTMGGSGLVPQPAADEAAVFAALAQAADQLSLVSELLVVPPPSTLDGSTPLRVLFCRDPSAVTRARTNDSWLPWLRHWLASAERRDV